MPIDVYKVIDDKLIYMNFSGDMTLLELERMVTVLLEIIESAEDTMCIHYIRDTGDVTDFPRNIPKVSKIIQQVRSNPKMGWTITVNIPNAFLKYLTTFIGKLTRSREKSVDTLDEALEFLRDVDEVFSQLTGAVFDQKTLYFSTQNIRQ